MKKNKRHSFIHSNRWGVIHPLRLVFGAVVFVIILILLNAGIYSFRQIGMSVFRAKQPANRLSPTPTPQNTETVVTPLPSSVTASADGLWKTFQSKEYGFSVTFPAKGIGVYSFGNCVKGRCDTKEMECGNDISYLASNNSTYYRIDSFFNIFIEKSDGKTMDQIIADANLKMTKRFSRTVSDNYTIVPLTGTGAKEAVAITEKSGALLGDDVPLSNTKAIYINNGYVFKVGGVQQLNLNCNAPLKATEWNIPRSIRYQ